MTLDVLLNSPFFTSKYKAIWKENPVVNQTSLRAFLLFILETRDHAPQSRSVDKYYLVNIIVSTSLTTVFFSPVLLVGNWMERQTVSPKISYRYNRC